MDAARFNFSHADHASHKKKFDLVVKLREELGLPIATILDTKGPEIGTFKTGKAELKKGISLPDDPRSTGMKTRSALLMPTF